MCVISEFTMYVISECNMYVISAFTMYVISELLDLCGWILFQYWKLQVVR